MKKISEVQAKKIFAEFLEFWKFSEEDAKKWGVSLRKNFESDWSVCQWAIVWEGGPYDWTSLTSLGGISEFGEDFGEGMKMPAGFHFEGIYSWAMGIYRL